MRPCTVVSVMDYSRRQPHSFRIGLCDAASPTPQEKEARYGRYSLLVDRDLSEGGARGKKRGIKRQYEDEKMRLDLARVAAERKKVASICTVGSKS